MGPSRALVNIVCSPDFCLIAGLNIAPDCSGIALVSDAADLGAEEAVGRDEVLVPPRVVKV
jgi:hypothetical protein